MIGNVKERGLVLIFIVVFILLVLVIGLVLYFLLFNKIKNNPAGKNQFSNNTLSDIHKLNPSTSVKHPKMYYASFEYNKKRDILVFRESGTLEDDSVFLSPTKPLKDKNTFSFEVTLVSKDGVLLKKGWKTLYIDSVKRISDPQIYDFKIYLPYSKNSIIKIANLEEKLIWTGFQ